MTIEDVILQERRKRMSWALDEMKRQYEAFSAEHLLISKYHREWWFRDSMQQSLEQIMARFGLLARALEQLEPEIAEYEFLLYRDYIARKELSESNDPFRGVSAKERLVQLEMFANEG